MTESHSGHASHERRDAGSGDHHAHVVAEFRRRFRVSLALTVPILLLAPMIQGWLGIGAALRFPGDRPVQFGLASAVFLYGGWPFLTGLVDELARATYRKMVQNLAWATGYNVVAIPLAAGALVGVGVLLSPAFGAERSSRPLSWPFWEDTRRRQPVTPRLPTPWTPPL